MMFEIFNYYQFMSHEDFFLIILLYTFIKYLITTTFNELTWPTQFFNRRHIINTHSARFRTFTENNLKLIYSTTFLNLYFKTLLDFKVFR